MYFIFENVFTCSGKKNALPDNDINPQASIFKLHSKHINPFRNSNKFFSPSIYSLY